MTFIKNNPFRFKKGHKINNNRPSWNKGIKKGDHPSLERMGFKKGNKTKSQFKNGHSGMKMENNPSWKGGKSFELYGLEFNNKLKEQIRKRDGYVCQECGLPECSNNRNLDIHHIDYNKKNNHLNNLISLCHDCHLKTNFKRKDWKNYFMRKL